MVSKRIATYNTQVTVTYKSAVYPTRSTITSAHTQGSYRVPMRHRLLEKDECDAIAWSPVCKVNRANSMSVCDHNCIDTHTVLVWTITRKDVDFLLGNLTRNRLPINL